MQNTPSGLKADPRDNPFYVPPPQDMTTPGRQPRQADALMININYNDPRSCPATYPGFSDGKLVAWDPKATAAFNYAGQIWSSVLNGGIPVIVDVCLYSKLPGDLLGIAAPSNWYSGFANAPLSGTSYPVALANQRVNRDLNGPDVPEIGASFSADYTWYYGIDGQVPVDQYDFVTTVLHEIGHGLGFLGSANWDDGTPAIVDGQIVNECNGSRGVGCLGSPPRAYDRFVEYGPKLVGGFDNPSLALGNALTSGGTGLLFNGPGANGGTQYAAVLYAPSSWKSGSSYSHLNDDTYDETTNALMTHALSKREAVHHPGPIALGILADQGWSVNSRLEVYVDRSNLGFEDGTAVNPFNSVREGTQAVLNGGTVWIRPGNYYEKLTLSRPMTLRGSTVTIGQ
jgi:hypothetical protein